MSHDFLNSWAGEAMLDKMSGTIKTPSGKASRQSLRGALVSSALPDDNIRLLEVMENYPTSEVIVEGEQLLELYENLNQVMTLIFPDSNE